MTPSLEAIVLLVLFLGSLFPFPVFDAVVDAPLSFGLHPLDVSLVELLEPHPLPVVEPAPPVVVAELPLPPAPVVRSAVLRRSLGAAPRPA